MTLRIDAVTLDCSDRDLMTRFWGGLTGRSVRQPPNHANYTALVDPDGGALILLQQVDEPRSTSKNRMHIDLGAADIEAEAKRAVGLGATYVQRYDEGGNSWIWMTDPEGNEFCICKE